MSEPVIFSTAGPVATITLHRPDCRNAVDGPTAALLKQAFARFDADAALAVAVLTGGGGQFCAGADLKAVADPARRNAVTPDGSGSGPMGPTRMAFTKPVIAAIEGHAVAGGLELALMCDLRVAAASAVFGVFCRRWGVPLIDGGTVRLPRIVGQGRALDMILTGRAVPAHEALAEAQALALQIAGFPQACLRIDRASALAQWDLDLPAALRHEGAAASAVVQAEGVAGAALFAAGAGRHGRPA
ncbi:crotonase/enoyl-CoA hydratase family protein [Aquabacterium sp. OR-4]|uniref:crotonase/enoyl-CoA hydratase family protein n=1 Tax=Aquabacterium sp. OR-4 TaxID=2978127 RepID=UPI0021B2E830|nr:crotonase/enoyl-CoA hydratase family protein [Aquabacterium sp. OR-4]MDT7835723.1 crotonase/enoyl-CoA hydratase family protein [Aquabacterium sp. OR-4]